MINEILADPPSSDAGREWVELASCGSEPVDLSGWSLASGTSSYGTSDPLPAGTVLGPGEHLVVGQSAAPEVDVVLGGWSLGNASTSADAVQLRDTAGQPIDTVVYGGTNPDGWVDDQGGIAVSLAPAPGEGRTVGRSPDAVDTDDGADFVELAWPSPGAANDGTAPDCGGPGSGLVINELLPDPEGPDDGAEWVELYHAGEAPVDLAGWALESGTTGWSVRFRWTEGRVEPGARLLVGGAAVEGVDVVAGISLGNASTSADGVRIVDCLGAPVDTVVYGPANPDGFVDDGGEVAVSLAPSPGPGWSLARVRDGYDSDLGAEDFAVAAVPTPGAANAGQSEPVCTPSAAVKLNEVLPDPAGTDEGAEWVELFNAGPGEIRLDGWSLRVVASAEQEESVPIPGGLTLGPGEPLLLGGADVEGASAVVDLALGNGTETDGVVLVDCLGAPVDTVLYGEAPNDDQLVDDQGEVPSPYGEPKDGAALARSRDGADTDLAGDWRVTHRPTPGASNTSSPISGGVAGPGCGGGAEPQGCAVSTGPVRGWAAGMLLLTLLRRGGPARASASWLGIAALLAACRADPAPADADADADAYADTDVDTDTDADTDTDGAADVWVPAPGISWQWQLSGRVDTSVDVDAYDVDLVETPDDVLADLQAAGRTVICYFSAGSYEEWRPDADRFPPAAIGEPLDGWPGEFWLDVRDPQVRAVIEARLDLAEARGCDAVEPDNVDGYANRSGFPLTRADQLDYNRFLADAAHRRGLSVGLKNAVELIDPLAPAFDWALNEECLAYDECVRNRPFLDAGKAVLHVEYVDRAGQAEAAAAGICADPTRAGFSTLIKTWDLDAFRLACP